MNLVSSNMNVIIIYAFHGDISISRSRASHDFRKKSYTSKREQCSISAWQSAALDVVRVEFTFNIYIDSNATFNLFLRKYIEIEKRNVMVSSTNTNELNR